MFTDSTVNFFLKDFYYFVYLSIIFTVLLLYSSMTSTKTSGRLAQGGDNLPEKKSYCCG